MIEEQIQQLIADLKKSADMRKATSKTYFTEELVIIRLKDILASCSEKPNS